MKWRRSTKPQIGDTKITKHFAVLPIKVLDNKTKQFVWIWLETYYTLHVYMFDWASWAGTNDWKIDRRYID